MRISSMKNVLSYVKYIMEEPSNEILEYFASMPSNESGRGEEILEYAPRLSKEEIKQIFLMRTYEPIEYFYSGTALNYSVMRATEEEKSLINYYKEGYSGILGKYCRQEKDRKLKRQRDCYGKAAFYPVRVLEKKIVLYGAGRLGQDLHKRLEDDGRHDIVLWVDKNAETYRKNGLKDVRDVCGIEEVVYDQIVIAVATEELARKICGELKGRGIEKEKLVWFPIYQYPNQAVTWNRKETG